jgi:CRISPR-associated protein Cas8b1/Cst1 subtype I-B
LLLVAHNYAQVIFFFTGGKNIIIKAWLCLLNFLICLLFLFSVLKTKILTNNQKHKTLLIVQKEFSPFMSHQSTLSKKKKKDTPQNTLTAFLTNIGTFYNHVIPFFPEVDSLYWLQSDMII